MVAINSCHFASVTRLSRLVSLAACSTILISMLSVNLILPLALLVYPRILPPLARHLLNIHLRPPIHPHPRKLQSYPMSTALTFLIYGRLLSSATQIVPSAARTLARLA
jgi:hypothetical protein